MHFQFVAPVSKCFRESYDQVFKGSKETATDFRGLSQEAGVYLLDSFLEKSLTLDQYDLYKFLTGKELLEDQIESGLKWNLSAKDYLIHKALHQDNIHIARHIVQNGNILRA